MVEKRPLRTESPRALALTDEETNLAYMQQRGEGPDDHKGMLKIELPKHTVHRAAEDFEGGVFDRDLLRITGNTPTIDEIPPGTPFWCEANEARSLIARFGGKVVEDPSRPRTARPAAPASKEEDKK